MKTSFYQFSGWLTSILVAILIFSACSSSRISTSPESERTQMERDIEYLASDALEGRATGEAGEKLAAEYIKNRMMALGLEPRGTVGYFQDFKVKNKDNPHATEFSDDGEITVRNVIGYLDHGGDHTIVIGAHYDHLGYGGFGSLHAEGPAIHNGADDNASGVAGMLYLAEKLKKNHTANNYLFIAFSGEEHGLWGSNYFTKNPTVELASVSYMINMDMIGRLKEERKLAINGTGTSPSWDILDKIKVKGLSIVKSEGGLGASDHSSFYTSEIPALHFFTGQHEDYHKPSDDEEKINYSGMSMVLQYIEKLIAKLDDDVKLAFTETVDADQQSRRSFAVTLGVMPDYLFEGDGMKIDGVRPDRPAAKAGIEKGDVVIQMGEYPVDGMEAYMNLLAKFSPGETVLVKIRRGNEVLEKTVTFD